ncbi:hypothetical protein [Oceanibacterium hippocampi]|uniref:Uncharacterized protein n=1 Tax=Oceanibacterium hippocampi TaxID=745714 RepID=A0A1Y5SWW7_9PROT|nr:hypothetical protein [Oceanibacterium hippocampi]SLN50294.1 hypothetical protein OCH7691_02213 [Oceanibacterium hippocampi]
MIAETRKAWAGALAAVITGTLGYYFNVPAEILVPLGSVITGAVVYFVSNRERA